MLVIFWVLGNKKYQNSPSHLEKHSLFSELVEYLGVPFSRALNLLFMTVSITVVFRCYWAHST